MAITTPALSAMNTFKLLPEAYDHANGVLQREGIEPLQAYTDTEVQRHHYAVAAGFHHDVYRLQALAGVAFSDRHMGDHKLMQLSDASPAERVIAIDFDSSPLRSFTFFPCLFKYVTELKQLGDIR